jgi:hypothetical protein
MQLLAHRTTTKRLHLDSSISLNRLKLFDCEPLAESAGRPAGGGGGGLCVGCHNLLSNCVCVCSLTIKTLSAAESLCGSQWQHSCLKPKEHIR